MQQELNLGQGVADQQKPPEGGQPEQTQTGPTAEELQTQIAERDRQINELGTRNSTLEKIITERQTFQPQQQPQRQQSVSSEPNLDLETKKIFEKAVNDGDVDSAARELNSLLKNAESNVVSRVNQELQTVLAVKDGVSDLVNRKSHLKNWKDDVQSRMAQYVMAGWAPDQAMRQVEDEYDRKFQGIIKEEQKMPAGNQTNVQTSPPKPQVPPGAVGVTSQSPPPIQEAPREETYQEYMDRRMSKAAGKAFNLRK